MFRASCSTGPRPGFAVPVGEWIKGPLRDWAEDLLDPPRCRAEGWFDADMVAAPLEGASRRQARIRRRRLWSMLMFQAWLREQKVPSAAAA